MYTLNCYMNTVTLKLYRTHELVERRNKCGLFVNTLISTAALIRERRLLNYFRWWCGAYSRAVVVWVAALNRSFTVLSGLFTLTAQIILNLHVLRSETGRHCVPRIPENVRICQRCSYCTSSLIVVSKAAQGENSLMISL